MSRYYYNITLEPEEALAIQQKAQELNLTRCETMRYLINMGLGYELCSIKPNRDLDMLRAGLIDLSNRLRKLEDKFHD